MIDMSKKYRYRSEKVAPLLRILCVDVPGNSPIVSCNISGVVYTHHPDGRIFSAVETEYDLIEVSPYEDIPIDAKVLVRMHVGEEWQKRHFAGVSINGRPKAWDRGQTSWTEASGSSAWGELKLPEE